MTDTTAPALLPWQRVQRALRPLGLPSLAILTALLIGGLVILITSRDLAAVGNAYWGLLRGALFKTRGLSESLVATIPYIFLSLGLAVGFKSGLFNIGVEGQFYIGALSAAWAGQITKGLPALIHLPLALAIGALGGAIWAAIPGYLKVKTGAHEVISTMMMNYIAFRLTEYMIMGPLRAKGTSSIQTPTVSPNAELWTFAAIPDRLKDPWNAALVALIMVGLAVLLVRWRLPHTRWNARLDTPARRRGAYLGVALAVGVISFFALPFLTRLWWPFTDQYDRLHTGLLLAIAAAVFVWWLLWKTTLGFELRMVGANPNAARYAGVNTTRCVVVAMAISGALAGLAGTLEVLGVSICRCLPVFFSSGYGFDSIAIALLAKNSPFGILASAFLFGAMRNGADTMEMDSGVSKNIISLVQALVLLFVAAPMIMRWLYRIKADRSADSDAPLTRGWGG